MALMAKAKAIMGLVVLVALIRSADVAAQSTDCQTEITTLVPCLTYVAGNDKNPSAACCSALAKVVNTNATCLCLVLSGNSGYQFNQTKALALPAACNVGTPPVSDCNKGAPTPSPTPGLPHFPDFGAPTPSPTPGLPHFPDFAPPPHNAGAMFAPSMVAIFPLAALILMKIFS